MITKIKNRYHYSIILLRQMVITDFKLRYQGSVLGYVWSLLRPLFIFVIMYFVFVKFLRIGADIPNYPVYLLLGIILWNFFAEITSNGISAIVGRSDLIRKINFPKYVILLSNAVSALINLALNLLVVSVFLYLNHISLGIGALMALVYIAEIFVFAVALSFILSALFVRLRDVNYIWEVFMQALFYATPIIYPLSMVTEQWPKVSQLLLLNPVAQAIQDIRQVVVTPTTETLSELSNHWYVTGIPFVLVIASAICAIFYFKKRSPRFAEEV